MSFFKIFFWFNGRYCLDEIAELEKQAQNNEPEYVIKERLNYILPICRESITEYQLILDRLEAL